MSECERTAAVIARIKSEHVGEGCSCHDSMLSGMAEIMSFRIDQLARLVLDERADVLVPA